jgi:hypothetical protein
MIVSLEVSRPVISQSIQTRGCLERDSGIVLAWDVVLESDSSEDSRVSGLY